MSGGWKTDVTKTGGWKDDWNLTCEKLERDGTGSGTTGGSDKSSETDSTSLSEETRSPIMVTGIPSICANTHVHSRTTTAINPYGYLEVGLSLMPGS